MKERDDDDFCFLDLDLYRSLLFLPFDEREIKKAIS